MKLLFMHPLVDHEARFNEDDNDQYAELVEPVLPGDPDCPAEYEGWLCTRLRHHPMPHVAGSREIAAAVWED